MRSIVRRLHRCISAALILGIALSAGVQALGEAGNAVEELPPSCTETGYVMTYSADGTSVQVENLPALGHRYGEWVYDEAEGVRTRTCAACGFQERLRISSASEDDFPRLNLTGSMEGIGKKNRVVLDAEYVSPEQSFRCCAITTLQGHSSIGYPKRNYTVRFYDDAQGEYKHKLCFENWNPEHKYILKANYADMSLCRNLVGAEIWRDMAASRAALSPRLAALPTRGAVDGFPVIVYLNDAFLGLYTLNLHKDEDLYGMVKGEQAAVVICNRQTMDEALFRAPAQFAEDYSSDWEIEYCGTEDETWVRERFNALCDFVMNSTDAEFRDGLHAHLDVDAAVDYLIFIYALGLSHSGAKDLVLLNYGDVWIPSAYDMDETFGLRADEGRYAAPEEFLPEVGDGVWDSGTGSLLWDRLLNAFTEEIRARYASLRRDVLCEAGLLDRVEAFTGAIPEAFYDMDSNLYPDRFVSDPDMKAQIQDYIGKRLTMLDRALEEDA